MRICLSLLFWLQNGEKQKMFGQLSKTTFFLFITVHISIVFLSKNKHTNAEKLTFNKTFLRCWQWYRCNFHLIFIKLWACKQKHFYVSKNFGTLPRHSKRCRENINDNHSFSVKRSFYLFLFAQMVAQSCLWQTNWKNAQFHGI